MSIFSDSHGVFPIARFKYRMASAFLMVMNSPVSEKGDFYMIKRFAFAAQKRDTSFIFQCQCIMVYHLNQSKSPIPGTPAPTNDMVLGLTEVSDEKSNAYCSDEEKRQCSNTLG